VDIKIQNKHIENIVARDGASKKTFSNTYNRMQHPKMKIV
jgi:ABC-type phosphate transport system ATPase subunit